MFKFIIKDSWVMLSHLFDSFIGDFEKVYVQCLNSAVRLYFAVLVCLSFSWDQHYSFSALNIVDSLFLVFTPIAPCVFEQVLPNLSSFDQFNVSSSLRNLVKPKKSEKQLQSFVWKLIAKPGGIFGCVFLRKCSSAVFYLQT